ncbi:11212_t:CDS:1, partial [Paraglomus brasilianum]
EGQEELLNVVNEMKRKMEDITSNIEGDVYEDDILYENIW